jgi:hypothetical protein
MKQKKFTADEVIVPMFYSLTRESFKAPVRWCRAAWVHDMNPGVQIVE